MPHIHTAPGQHDMTMSAYIVRNDGDDLKCLVHMHKKLGVLMQIGGHIELDETPWQTVAHELVEESGYSLDDLRVLQPTDHIATIQSATVHPVPCLMNTHKVSDDHYHSDLCYVFVADSVPAHPPEDGESADVRWMTIEDMQNEADKKVALQDVVDIYRVIAKDFLPVYKQLDANLFSLDKPAKSPF